MCSADSLENLNLNSGLCISRTGQVNAQFTALMRSSGQVAGSERAIEAEANAHQFLLELPHVTTNRGLCLPHWICTPMDTVEDFCLIRFTLQQTLWRTFASQDELQRTLAKEQPKAHFRVPSFEDFVASASQGLQLLPQRTSS